MASTPRLRAPVCDRGCWHWPHWRFVRFGLGFAYRYGLFRSAHRLDADLRNLVYERLTELSFSYWDRTQTGQVISRANSDIRSIQLLFAFAPLVATQLVMLVMGPPRWCCCRCR